MPQREFRADLLRSWPPRAFGLTTADLLSALTVLLLTVGYLPGGVSPFGGIRLAALLLVVPIGWYLILTSATSGDRASIGAAVAGTVVLCSAALSGVPQLSLLGTLNAQWSGLTILGAIACWALGRETSEAGRRLLGHLLVFVVTLSVVVAVAQLLVQPVGSWSLLVGRPGGLAGHPAYLGAHAAAMAAFVVWHLSNAATWWHLVGLTVAAFGVGLAGSRLGLAVVVVLLIIARARTHSRCWLRVALAMASGLGLAELAHRWTSSTDSAVSRISAGGGMSDRWQVWLASLEGWWDRPLFGWGPGRFVAGVEPRLPEHWVTRLPWDDAHNYFVHVAVTLGLLGVVAIAGFGWYAVRRTRGPLLWAAAALAVSWLLEPAPPSTHAVAFLLVGASTVSAARRVGPPEARARRFEPGLVTCLLVSGLLAASWSMAAEVTLESHLRAVGPPPFEGVATWHNADPRAASLASDWAHSADDLDDRSVLALQWARRAVSLEPDVARWQSELAIRALQAGHLDEAREAATKALQYRSEHPVALQVLQVVLMRTGDRAAFESVTKRVCAAQLPQCGLDFRAGAGSGASRDARG